MCWGLLKKIYTVSSDHFLDVAVLNATVEQLFKFALNKISFLASVPVKTKYVNKLSFVEDTEQHFTDLRKRQQKTVIKCS